MRLRSLIQKAIKPESLRLHDWDGKPMDPAQAVANYLSIRTYIALHHSQPDSRVAIRLRKDPYYLMIVLACMEVGTPYIPMGHDYPDDRVEQIAQDAPFSLLVDSPLLQTMLQTTPQVVALPNVSSEREAYTIFTSGSTGRPKGVMIPRGAVENFFIWMDHYYANITSKDRMLLVTQFTFDIALVDVGLFLTKRLELFFSQFEGNIFRLAHEIEEYQITALNTVPNNANMLLEDSVKDRADYSSLRCLMLGGARFTYGLWQKCRDSFNGKALVHNFYGPTECTIYSHCKRLSFNEASDLQDHNVSIGNPVDNVTSIILNGELLLGGRQLMRGYANNPSKTAEVLIQHQGTTWYRTGDLSLQNPAGEYHIVGRMDDTIKHRGYRVNLLDIDSYILRLPYVQDCATIAIEDEIAENITVGYIILRETRNVKEIRSDLAAFLLSYQVPEKIIITDQFPVNSNGKVDRKALKAKYLQGSV